MQLTMQAAGLPMEAAMIWTFLISVSALIIAVVGCALLGPREETHTADVRVRDPAEWDDDLIFRQDPGG
jgi:hypothetical protein